MRNREGKQAQVFGTRCREEERIRRMDPENLHAKHNSLGLSSAQCSVQSWLLLGYFPGSQAAFPTLNQQAG